MADVTVSTPVGFATAQGAFQYVSSMHVYPIPGALDAIAYDQSRQRLYVSNQDHNRVEIFDLASSTFLSPITVGDAPTSIAITADAQLLAVVNYVDGTVSVIDLSRMQVVATHPLLTPAELNRGLCVTQISPATLHRNARRRELYVLSFWGFGPSDRLGYWQPQLHWSCGL